MNDRGFNSEPGIRSLGVFSQLWLRVTNRFHGYVYPKRGDELSSLLINIVHKVSNELRRFHLVESKCIYQEIFITEKQTSMTIKKYIFFLPTKNLYIYFVYTLFLTRDYIILDPLFQVYVRLK